MSEELAPAAKPEKPNILIGAMAGLTVALVSSLIWFAVVVITNYQLGIVAIIVGWLIGFCTLKATGGKTSRTLQIIAIAITIFAMGLSEYLVVNHFTNEYLDEEGEGKYLPLMLPPNAIAEIIYESIAADPLTLLFWAIAVYQAYKQLEPRQVVKQTTT
ncbi:MAG: hypothetical protein PHG85_01980 [Candidatus Altiarchaeota archaeon]|nr:hypothetical protein [Candidatus Altiarchaeota archaeon]